MVKLSIIAGPFRGEVRRFNGDHNLDRNIQTDPAGLLRDLVSHGSVWSFDFSEASEEEKFTWGRADLVARIIRALTQGRPVHFMSRVFTRLEEAGELEDAIVNSGRMVSVDRDDKQMLVVAAIGYEEV